MPQNRERTDAEIASMSNAELYDTINSLEEEDEHWKLGHDNRPYLRKLKAEWEFRGVTESLW